MPDRRYFPREPPSLVDRLLHHPLELMLAAWWAATGAVLVASLAWSALPTSPSVTGLPWPLATALAALVGTGGVLVLCSLLVPWARLDRAWRLERVGLVLAATGWVMYAAAVVLAYPSSLISWSLGLVMAAGSGLRLAATLVVEARTRQAIADQGA